MRSYDGPFRIDGLTIWQASRATSAAPTFFERLEIGTNEFIDGGMGSNNPSKALFNETQRLFKQDHDRTLACIISIGTGVPKRIDLAKLDGFGLTYIKDLVKALSGMATDCQEIAEEMTAVFKATPSVYIRFDVEQGLQVVRIKSYEDLNIIRANTQSYLIKDAQQEKLTLAAKSLTSEGPGQWLRQNRDPWLLIIDSVDDLEQSNVLQLLPDCSHGAILITSSKSNPGSLGGIERSIEIRELDENSSVELLFSKIKDTEYPPREKAINVVTSLHGLPLAIEHSAVALRPGASPNPHNPDGSVPIHHAADKGHSEVVELLSSWGSNEQCSHLPAPQVGEKEDDESIAPLCSSEPSGSVLAADNEDIEVVELLWSFDDDARDSHLCVPQMEKLDTDDYRDLVDLPGCHSWVSDRLMSRTLTPETYPPSERPTRGPTAIWKKWINR
ncbi:hypothetical protein KCU87_g7654, partial [Aureobasidium melanogenum]